MAQDYFCFMKYSVWENIWTVGAGTQWCVHTRTYNCCWSETIVFIVKDWDNARTSLDRNPAKLALAGASLQPGPSSPTILTSFVPSLL